MRKRAKPKKHTATTLVRISAGHLRRLRDEAKRRGMTLRALGDRAVEAYLSQPGS